MELNGDETIAEIPHACPSQLPRFVFGPLVYFPAQNSMVSALSLEQAGRGAYDAPRWRVPSRQKEHNMHSTAYAHQLKNGEWEVIVDRHDSITRKLFHEQVPQIGFYRIQRKTGSP
jgi:hypothetical protein